MPDKNLSRFLESTVFEEAYLMGFAPLLFLLCSPYSCALEQFLEAKNMNNIAAHERQDAMDESWRMVRECEEQSNEQRSLVYGISVQCRH